MFPPKPASNKIKLIIEENELDSSSTSNNLDQTSTTFNDSKHQSHHHHKRSKKRASISSPAERKTSSENKENSSVSLTKSNSLNLIKPVHVSHQISETDYYSPISASSSLSSTKHIHNLNSNCNNEVKNTQSSKPSRLSSTINTAKQNEPAKNTVAKMVDPGDSNKAIKSVGDQRDVYEKRKNSINDQMFDASNLNYDAITQNTNDNSNSEHFYTSTDEFIESIACDSTCMSLQNQSKDDGNYSGPVIEEIVEDNKEKETKVVLANGKSNDKKSKKRNGTFLMDISMGHFDIFTYFCKLLFEKVNGCIVLAHFFCSLTHETNSFAH
jgi:hypothetical protein